MFTRGLWVALLTGIGSLPARAEEAAKGTTTGILVAKGDAWIKGKGQLPREDRMVLRRAETRHHPHCARGTGKRR
ncbi:MAG: hypothetical protein ACYDBB_23550 [Armatimonadota bacterium]